MRRFGLAFLIFVGMAARTGVAAPAPPGCKAAMHRQFDFWLGKWNVYDYSKKKELQGTNDVTMAFNGCVLQEHWTATDGSSGSSFNIFDRSRGVWHQTWVDTSGQLLLLDGEMKNGVMVLQGPGHREGKPFYNRITWTPLPDGTVRQHWQRSKDLKTWTEVFDGLYVKK